ncbi:MAG: nitrilase family protein [Alistipes sp.]|nr:nitrilase family protein [Candidatus Alistipes equi]
MKVALLQISQQWADIDSNILRAERLFSSVTADLYILPEMWDTGFVVDSDEITPREEDSKALEWMKAKTRERDCAVVGSTLVRVGEEIFNRAYFVSSGEVLGSYDKFHLFAPGGETKYVSKGQRRTIVEWRGVRFLLCICYDLRFPVWCRNRMEGSRPQYDVMLEMACWPTSRMLVWKTLLAARAIENQAIVIGSNRAGTDPYCEYPGMSMCVNSYGEIQDVMGSREGAFVTTLPLGHLEHFRNHFLIFDDADDFEIKNLHRYEKNFINT